MVTITGKFVTITEKFSNGILFQYVTADVNGKEVVLKGRAISGERFADVLAKYEEGFVQRTFVDVSGDAFRAEGKMKLKVAVLEKESEVA